METTIDYTTAKKAGMMKLMGAPPQINRPMKEQVGDSSWGSLWLSERSLTAPITGPVTYWLPWESLLEKEMVDGSSVLILPRRLIDPLYGRMELDAWLRDKSSGAPSIEEVWRITEKLPSLTDLLLEERNNE